VPLATVRGVKPRRLLGRLARGHLENVDFADLRRLAEALGFELKRVSGSHHIFGHSDVRELVNFQEVGAQVKPYQIRQFMRLIERYDLRLGEE